MQETCEINMLLTASSILVKRKISVHNISKSICILVAHAIALALLASANDMTCERRSASALDHSGLVVSAQVRRFQMSRTVRGETRNWLASLETTGPRLPARSLRAKKIVAARSGVRTHTCEDLGASADLGGLPPARCTSERATTWSASALSSCSSSLAHASSLVHASPSSIMHASLLERTTAPAATASSNSASNSLVSALVHATIRGAAAAMRCRRRRSSSEGLNAQLVDF